VNTLELRYALAELSAGLPAKTTLADVIRLIAPVEYGRCATCELDIARYPGEPWLHVQGAFRQCQAAADYDLGNLAHPPYGKRCAKPARSPDDGSAQARSRQAMQDVMDDLARRRRPRRRRLPWRSTG
jgi:hypothetical protein